MGDPRIERIGIVDVEFGDDVTVVEPVVGKRCRIQSHAFLCDLVEIGDDCFISHGAMFINDSFSGGGPARGDRSLYGSTRIGNHVSIGTNATVLPVSICDHVVVGAGSVVTRDITRSGIYAGNPAHWIRSLDQDGEGAEK